MPSSKNYKRDLDREYAVSKQNGNYERVLERNKLRKQAIKKGIVKRGDGKDLDHKVPLSKGGSNTLKNTRVQSPSKNRSFARNKDGSMK